MEVSDCNEDEIGVSNGVHGCGECRCNEASGCEGASLCDMFAVSETAGSELPGIWRSFVISFNDNCAWSLSSEISLSFPVIVPSRSLTLAFNTAVSKEASSACLNS